MAELGPTEVNGSLAVNRMITKPLQPSFNVYLTSSQYFVLANTVYTLKPYTVKFDIGSNFNTTTGKFIAPIAGKYQFSANIEFRSLQTNATYYWAWIKTTKPTNCLQILDPTKFSTTINYRGFNFSILADMDVGDEAWIDVYQAAGTANTAFITGTDPVYNSFTGFLAC